VRDRGFVARSLLLALAMGLFLSACGKKGPPDPPGPPAKITFPKSYPTR
jgi:predicted small lipoprotein YifL